MTNVKNTVLYVGVTNDLGRRIHEHKNDLNDGFTKRYHICKLVYAEEIEDIKTAILREKQIKKWSRAKKDELINSLNPNWEEIMPI